MYEADEYYRARVTPVLDDGTSLDADAYLFKDDFRWAREPGGIIDQGQIKRRGAGRRGGWRRLGCSLWDGARRASAPGAGKAQWQVRWGHSGYAGWCAAHSTQRGPPPAPAGAPW